jgi:ATP synthase F1 delta subunit
MSMNGDLIIAKRYAQAFLNVFSIVESDLEKIRQVIHFLDTHKQVFSLLKVPLLDSAIKKRALIDCLIERFKLPDSFKALIGLLVHQKRSYLIAHVLHCIDTLFQEGKGIETFTLASPDRLQENQIKALQQFLATQTHHTIMCAPVQDASLIAGIRMQSSEHLWEYSVKKQLAAIKKHVM